MIRHRLEKSLDGMGTGMCQQSFQDRLARISQNSGQVQMLAGTVDPGGSCGQGSATGPALNRTGFLKVLATGVLMVPVGMAIALLTKIFLDPDITPAAVHYLPLLGLVAGSHLVLAGAAIGAVVARFRLVTLNHALLFVFAGYGLASAALAATVG